MFPTIRYRADGQSVTIDSQPDLDLLGSEWAASPAAFGIETCPGVEPDPEIAARRKPEAPIEAPKPEAPAEPEPVADAQPESVADAQPEPDAPKKSRRK